MRYHFRWEDSEIKSSGSGRFVSVFCRANGYFEIFKASNGHFLDKHKIDLLRDNSEEVVHFLSSFESVYSGCCTSLVWHTFADEFAALMPVNKKGEFLKAEEKVVSSQSGGLFSSKVVSTYTTAYSDTVAKVVFALFELSQEHKATPPRMIFKKDSYG